MMKKLTVLMIIGWVVCPVCADIWDDLAKYSMGDDGNPPPVEISRLIIETPADRMGPVEEKLIAIAGSKDAMPEARWFACRMLQRVGTERCVPVLAGLLCDETLSHYARLTLERMGDSDAAGKALRDALGRAPDRLKPGIAGSLGVRRDTHAVVELAGLAQSNKPQLALAGVKALGDIGGEAALKALQRVKPAASADLELSSTLDYGGSFYVKDNGVQVDEALRNAHADALLQAAVSVKSVDVIGDLWKNSGSDSLRSVSLAAMAEVDAGRAACMLSTALEGEGEYLFGAALNMLRDSPADELTSAALASLKKLEDGKKAAVVEMLGWRGDKVALPVVQDCMISDNVRLRRAAVCAAARLGDGVTVGKLLRCGLQSEKECVIASVAGMTGGGVDDALIAALDDKEVCLIATEALAQRETASAVPKLKKLAASEDGTLSKAAWEALGAIAADKDLGELLKISLGDGDRKMAPYELDALKSVCVRADNKGECIKVLGACYDNAGVEVKKFILDTAAAAGGNEGVKYIRSALESGSDELRLQAVRAMSAWVDHGSVCDILLDLAANAPEEKVRILALRGYIVHTKEEKNRKRLLEMLGKAKELAKRAEEKKQLVAAADSSRDEFVVPFLCSYVNDADVAEDARRALLGKALKCVEKKQHLKELSQALAVIANDPESEKGMARRAGEVLERIPEGQ